MLHIRFEKMFGCCSRPERLAEIEKRLHLAHVGAVYKCGVVEVSLALSALLCQNVAVVSVFSLDLSCAGECETLLRRAVGLYLWHFVCKFLVVCFYLGSTLQFCFQGVPTVSNYYWVLPNVFLVSAFLSVGPGWLFFICR